MYTHLQYMCVSLIDNDSHVECIVVFITTVVGHIHVAVLYCMFLLLGNNRTHMLQ